MNMTLIPLSVFKPRIRLTATGFSCFGMGKEGNGRTARAAYFDWLNEARFFPYL